MTALFAASLLSAGVLLGATPASADPLISAADEATMRAIWDDYGVAASTQDALLASLEAGQLWDSLTDETPVSVSTVPVVGGQETVEVFADGSISVVTLTGAGGSSGNQGGVTPQASLGSCAILSGSSYDFTRQCTVSTNVVVSNASFRVTYHAIQGAPTTITQYSNLLTECIGGACSNSHMVLDRATQSGSLGASVTGWWRWTAYGGAASKDFWLNFYIVGTVPSVSNN